MSQVLNHHIPNTGTTIFTVMSTLAAKHGAVNLSQGFPDFQIDAALGAAMSRAIADGFNQYAPMPGLPALREAIAHKIAHFQNVQVNPEAEITVTPGATYGIYTACSTLLNPGDEVIILEPAYDSYVPNIRLCGGIPVAVALDESFAVDWQQVENAVSVRTKAIIFNNPHNPSGSVWSPADFDQLHRIAEAHDLYIIADEVYEHLVYDGAQHISVLQHEGLRSRSFAMYSFGKIFHNTGWKMGYVAAPAQLTLSFRMIHQFLAFSVNTPAQQALADYLQDLSRVKEAAALPERKRDLFLDLMSGTRFKCLKPAAGSYFQLLDYSDISDQPDRAFAEWLTEHHKVATIPLSPFYSKPYSGKLLRFCFAKKDETLQQAAALLKHL